MACQSEARRAYIQDYEKKQGRIPPQLTDRLDDFQRGEARDFAAKYPDLATQDFSEELKPKPEAKDDYLSRVKELSGAAKTKLESLYQRVKALWAKDVPAVPAAASAAADAAVGAVEGSSEIEAIARQSDPNVGRVFDEVKSDPAGALRRAAARKRQNEQNLDPEMKGYLKPDQQ